MMTASRLLIRHAWLLSTLLVACASQIPVNIRQAPRGGPSLPQVRANLLDFRSQPVRWGGEILNVENRETATWVTVLAQPLHDDGEPNRSDNSEGRFLARIPVFLDPKVYQAERRITVRGTLTGSETRQVGQFPYRYPVVDATDWYLWPKQPAREPGYDSPYWYDPVFPSPWYYDPWYRYPYYPHHLHRD